MTGVVNVLMATTDETGGGGGGGGGTLVATASPSTLFGYALIMQNLEATVVTDSPATATAVNGVPPYTYSWTRVSGNAATYAETPTARYTKFGSFFEGGGPLIRNSVWKCTVTDAASTVVDTNTISVSLRVEEFSYDGGPIY